MTSLTRMITIAIALTVVLSGVPGYAHAAASSGGTTLKQRAGKAGDGALQTTLAAATLAAGSAVTRERTAVCNSDLDSWLNTSATATWSALITIESVTSVTCGELQVTVDGTAVNGLSWYNMFDEKEASGPHIVEVPPGKRIAIRCVGDRHQGECKAKYTFQWAGK
jgi:hypothetical protein